MSKYKAGDKVVMEITDRFKNAYGHEYYSILDSVYSTEFIDEKSEPLRNYTEPLERKNENKQKQIEKLVDKLHRQATEITRLLAENKELKWEKAKGEVKVGDVVSREGLYGVVKSVSDDWLNGITASGISFQWLKRKCTKTGRHIDIDGFLKQIRGEQE